MFLFLNVNVKLRQNSWAFCVVKQCLTNTAGAPELEVKVTHYVKLLVLCWHLI